MKKKVTANTTIELYELCLDVCPFPTGDRENVCPKCPVTKQVKAAGWRLGFADSLKVIKSWATYVGKQV